MSERIRKQTSEMHGLHVVQQIVRKVSVRSIDTRHQHISDRTGEKVDVLVPHFAEDILDGVMMDIPQERISDRIVK